jgi:hypothetical protein
MERVECGGMTAMAGLIDSVGRCRFILSNPS